jgi:hypothetical protein
VVAQPLVESLGREGGEARVEALHEDDLDAGRRDRLEALGERSEAARNSRGSGSKVSTALARPRSRACAATLRISAAWPRCTPSKLPIASAVSAAGRA